MPNIVDPLAWVRERPEQFFGQAVPEAVHLLPYPMADILRLGGGECIIRQEEEWFVIGSNVDWLRHEEYGPADLFTHVIPAPAHGAHSMRGEILINAFARDVSLVSPEGVTSLRGTLPPRSVKEKASGMARAIAFRM